VIGRASTSFLVYQTPVGYALASRMQWTVSPVAVVVLLIRSTMTWWLAGPSRRVRAHRQARDHMPGRPVTDP